MNTFLASRFVSWTALTVAVLLWSCVGYFARTISIAAEAHRVRLAGMEQQTVEQAAALRTHALARATKEDRTRLAELSSVDLVEMLETIESLARDLGLRVEMAQAPSITSSDSSPLRTASLSVEALGSFTQVAQVVTLLETIRIPSMVDEVRFERTPANEKTTRTTWRVIVRLRFFTTADIPAV